MLSDKRLSQSVGTYDALDTRNRTVAKHRRSQKFYMDPFKGILVQVISNGQILKSYDDPDTSDIEDPFHRQQYIEAVTGATFAVKVIITDQFDWCHISRKDGIVVELRVDGFDWGHSSCTSRENIEKYFRKGEPRTYDFDYFTHFSDKTGQWMKSEYSFSALKLSM